LQRALESVIPELRRTLDISRASVRCLSGESVSLEAVWSAEPTELSSGLTYRYSGSSLSRDSIQRLWPVITTIEAAAGSLEEGILYQEGLRSRATIPIGETKRGYAFLTVSSKHPAGFQEKELSPLTRAAGALLRAVEVAEEPNGTREVSS
jgi:hypothetical protein